MSVAVLGWRDNAVGMLAIYEGARLERRAVLDVPVVCGLALQRGRAIVCSHRSRVQRELGARRIRLAPGQGESRRPLLRAPICRCLKARSGRSGARAAAWQAMCGCTARGRRRRLTSDGAERIRPRWDPTGSAARRANAADEAGTTSGRTFPTDPRSRLTFGNI